MYVVLNRLIKHRYLREGERQYGKFGPAQKIYALDVEGWDLYYPNTMFRESTVLDGHILHTLDVGDVWLEMMRYDKRGYIEIRELLTEPDCHGKFGRVIVEPDLTAKLVAADGSALNMFLEVDEWTERKRVVKNKLNTYWNAFVSAHTAGASEVFPRPVVWLVPDHKRGRIKELESWIEELPEERRKLFRVMSFSDLYARLLRV